MVKRNRDCENIVVVDKKLNQIILKRAKGVKEPAKTFTFDSVFNIDTTQRSIYEDSAFPLVESVIEGYNGKHRTLNSRHHLCLWTDGMWKDIYNGRYRR
jgi:hypothetical protein